MATRLTPPRLILVSGPPGAGKSTLTRSLAARYQATHLDKDCIDDLFSPNDRGPRYTRVIEPKVLAAVLNLAELNLRPGHIVFIDVPWTHILLNSPEWIPILKKLVRRTRSRLTVLECVIDEATLRARLRDRGYKKDRPRLTPEGWRRFRRTDRLGELNPLPHTVIDLSQTRTACVRAAIQAVESK